MSNRPVIILGGGGHASVVISTLRLLREPILGYTDPEPDDSPEVRVPYLGSDDVLASYSIHDTQLAVGLGSTESTNHRARLFEEQQKVGFDFVDLVHPSATVAPEASLGLGIQVMAGAVIQPGALLSKNVLVNTSASIDHDCVLEAHVHVASGATLSGEVHLETGVHVGAGATVIQGVRVGAESTIGAGAVVIDNVPPNSTVIGVPAHPITG